MGTSRTGAELARKMDQLAKDLSDPKRPLNVVGVEAKKVFLGSAAAAGALGAKPQGKRKKISARYDFGGKKMKVDIGVNSIVVFYTGPAHLINNATEAHEILPRRRPGVRTRRKQQASALHYPGASEKTNFSAGAKHPGTTGKHFFEAARAIVERTAPRTYIREGLTAPLRRVF